MGAPVLVDRGKPAAHQTTPKADANSSRW